MDEAKVAEIGAITDNNTQDIEDIRGVLQSSREISRSIGELIKKMDK